MHVDEQLSDGNGLGVERIYDFSTVNGVVNFRWFINFAPLEDRERRKSLEIHVAREFYLPFSQCASLFAHTQSPSIIFYGNINEHEPSKDNKKQQKSLE
jgi:hypothetical protein